MHICTNISEVHSGPKSTANFRCIKYCSLLMHRKIYYKDFTKFFIKIYTKLTYSYCTLVFVVVVFLPHAQECSHSSTFEAFQIYLQNCVKSCPTDHIRTPSHWQPVPYTTDSPARPAFHPQSLSPCPSSCPLASCFFIFLILSI